MLTNSLTISTNTNTIKKKKIPCELQRHCRPFRCQMLQQCCAQVANGHPRDIVFLSHTQTCCLRQLPHFLEVDVMQHGAKALATVTASVTPQLLQLHHSRAAAFLATDPASFPNPLMQNTHTQQRHRTPSPRTVPLGREQLRSKQPT